MIGLVKSKTLLHVAALVLDSYSQSELFGQAISSKYPSIKKAAQIGGFSLRDKGFYQR